MWQTARMIDRRTLIATGACTSAFTATSALAKHAPSTLQALTPTRHPGRPNSYPSFLAGIKNQAGRLGVDESVLNDALALDRPNSRVLELDRHQPEFTLTWAQYRSRVMTSQKIQGARNAYQQELKLLTGIWGRYAVDPRIVVGIWGLESNYGSRIGSFGVVDALATLAFDGRRAAFFRAELLNALQILQHRDIASDRMLGSYAGAMGQPQFMPSSYLRYAVDYDGDGRRDIWSSKADVFASISNYLSRSGWTAGVPWGQEIIVPSGFDTSMAGREMRKPLDTWMHMGVRRRDGSRFSRGDVVGAVLLPDGAGGDAFMVYSNFAVIRRYNPSDFYSLAVGLLGSSAG